MTKRERLSERPWTAPVALHDVSETGRHVELVADERTRAAIASSPGCAPCRALRPSSTSRGAAATVCGWRAMSRRPSGRPAWSRSSRSRTRSTKTSTCVCSTAAAAPADHGGAGVAIDARDGPEPLTGGVVDLGALATEFLILGVDPYPRKPGAVLEASSAGDDSVKPFAALAALKKGQGGTRDNCPLLCPCRHGIVDSCP